MRTALRVYAALVILALVGVSWWATSQVSIVPAIRALLERPEAGFNPWFIATLFDAYFGFLWFWLWVAYKEASHVARLLWLVLILTLGNMAMAAYVLVQLHRLPAGAGIDRLLLRNV